MHTFRTNNTMKITDLIQDDHNFNRGKAGGKQMLRESISELGAGRSVLVDKDNRIIAGNKTVEAAIAAGITEIDVVETTGDELVVVRRTDISLDSGKGRMLALADNAVQQATFEWDEEQLKEMDAAFGIDGIKWRAPIVREPAVAETVKTDTRIPLRFSLTSEQYEHVVQALRVYGDTLEEALLTLLEEYEDNRH